MGEEIFQGGPEKIVPGETNFMAVQTKHDINLTLVSVGVRGTHCAGEMCECGTSWPVDCLRSAMQLSVTVMWLATGLSSIGSAISVLGNSRIQEVMVTTGYKRLLP